MAAAPQKADVTLAVAGQHQAAAAGLKAGQTVRLSQASDGGVACSTASGEPLGSLAAGDCPPLVRQAASCTVRSIRRGTRIDGTVFPCILSSMCSDAVTVSAALGSLLGGSCVPLVRSSSSATVRSIRKAPGGDGGIAAVTLRVVVAAAQQHQPLQGWDDRPKEEATQDAESFRLPRGSLELLASSTEVRELLRSDQLRTAVAAVDSAERPEQALERALQNPTFNAFAEKVLATIGRGGAETDDRLAAILST